MSTKYADNAATEAAKKRYEDEKKGADKVRAASAAKLKGKPTPTQEENDLTMLGAHILEHEADGSDPDTAGQVSGNPGEASQKPAQSYQARQQPAAHKAE
jgi:hypothetical protein